jgi:hypothetical protein
MVNGGGMKEFEHTAVRAAGYTFGFIVVWHLMTHIMDAVRGGERRIGLNRHFPMSGLPPIAGFSD